MRGQYLERALGSDDRADTNLSAPTKSGEVSAAWAIAFVVCALLGLLSPFL
jgi:hypothetical protein